VSDPNETYKRAFHELEKIKRQVELLSDFLLSKIEPGEKVKQPRSKVMIDPRTNKPFKGK
jgi:hypothetical protein